MTHSAKTTSPAIITHTTASIKGVQDAAINVHHAHTPDARINLSFNGIHMTIRNCQAAQGLHEAFAAGRGHMQHIPPALPPVPPLNLPENEVTVALSVEFTRRPSYAVVAQSHMNRLKTAQVHWIDLFTGPITWQIRDRTALMSMIGLLRRVHKTAIEVFSDGELYNADPTRPGYTVAA